jgi:SpoVK/Ycf46/Vps4 family AAA+-type ATPase
MTAPLVAPYRGTEEHLADELRWLDTRLRVRTATFRQRLLTAQSPKALYVSHDEVDGLLGEGTSGPRSEAAADEIERLQRADRMHEESIAAKLARSADEGVYLALPHLAQLFSLSPFERRAVVICLAPELDRKYDRLYAYLQDDITRKLPSVDLVLDLLGDDRPERWAGRALLSGQSRLLRAGLLHEIGDPASPSGASDLARFLRLDPSVLNFLIGGPVESKLLDGLRADALPDASGHASDPETVHPGLVERLVRLVERSADLRAARRQPLTLYLHGPAGVGKRELALRVCERLGCQLLALDVIALLQRGADFERVLRAALREATLTQSVVYFQDAEPLFGEEARTQSAILARTAADYTSLIVLAGERHRGRPRAFRDTLFHAVGLPLPGPACREAVWRERLAPFSAPVAWAPELGRQFRLTPRQIGDAVTAATLDLMTHDDPASLALADLSRAARQQARHRLHELAVRIEPRVSWDGLILPPRQIAQLREICAQERFQHEVFDRWGFSRTIGGARGVSALFSGPPGTGKTLASEVIAGELQLDLYKVDLSGVVSKYIGETEKNLSRIFEEAESSNAILLFDEADALFGKRTKVSDAHDRYANIETSYLLQRIEAYDGIVVLTTNLRENMDEAFTRRLRFAVDFPFPDVTNRRAIWATLFPAEAPVDPGIDLDELARELKIAGGNIRNIVLNAAFLAAADGRAIAMTHLLHATRREFEKMGKLSGGVLERHANGLVTR